MPTWVCTTFLLATLGIATVTDVRFQKVPRWQTVGSIALGLLLAAGVAVAAITAAVNARTSQIK